MSHLRRIFHVGGLFLLGMIIGCSGAGERKATAGLGMPADAKVEGSGGPVVVSDPVAESAPRSEAPADGKSSVDRLGTVVGLTPSGTVTDLLPADGGGKTSGKMETKFWPGAMLPGMKPGEKAEAAEPKTVAKADVADPIAGDVSRKRKPKEVDNTPAGILTAGSFDDNVDPTFFRSFLSRRTGWLQNHQSTLSGRRVMIVVRDGANKPVMDARVKLQSGATDGPEITTRADGKAVFLLSFDGLAENQPLIAQVTPPDGGKTVVENIAAGVDRWDVSLPQVKARLPRVLDLAIVLDTTGSMGDEHRFVVAEIKGIAASLKRQYPEVEQRFALICYRDEGDEYVTRRFDFAGLDEFHRNLSAQKAGGGGDTPEAVHKGMEEALQLRWKDKDSARVILHIADAPPHAQHFQRSLKAVDQLRRRGIGVYPVACSGYDDPTEIMMRASALLTGSQFLFLTDDSGVGGSHAEPKIPYYQVERLERLIARMIATELTGQRIDANPADVIRTVGKRPNS